METINRPTIDELTNMEDRMEDVDYFDADEQILIFTSGMNRDYICPATKIEIIKSECGDAWEDIQEAVSIALGGKGGSGEYGREMRAEYLEPYVTNFELDRTDYTCYALNNKDKWEYNESLKLD